MQSIRLLTGIMFMLSTAIICPPSLAFPVNEDAKLHAELEHISKMQIFFGHQSVGMNILDGVKQLASKEGVQVDIREIKATSDVSSPMLSHAFIAQNGNPLQKIKSFEQTMGTQNSGPNVALMKFCFVDFTAETDVNALFAKYRSAIDDLKAKHPDTTFVHVTAPLTTVQGGFKQNLKRLLGRPPYGIIENIRREEYNALLRQTYTGHEPLFDLARIEATTPDGKISTVEWEGKIAPAMSPENTDDGGHLNLIGKLRAARELISVLSAIPESSSTRRRPN